MNLSNLKEDERKTYEALNKSLSAGWIGRKMYNDLNKIFIALNDSRRA